VVTPIVQVKTGTLKTTTKAPSKKPAEKPQNAGSSTIPTQKQPDTNLKGVK
jgi:hypothetical protein